MAKCLFLAVFGAAGCADPMGKPVPELPRSEDLLADVPFVLQNDYECGASALWSLLRYEGEEVEFDDLRTELYQPGRNGTTVWELVAAAGRRGMEVEWGKGDEEILLRSLREDVPVLAMFNYGTRGSPKNHFLVVIGRHPTRPGWICHTGRAAFRFYPDRWFRRWWGGAGNMYLKLRNGRSD